MQFFCIYWREGEWEHTFFNPEGEKLLMQSKSEGEGK